MAGGTGARGWPYDTKKPSIVGYNNRVFGEGCQAGLGVFFVPCQALLVKPTLDLPFSFILLKSMNRPISRGVAMAEDKNIKRSAVSPKKAQDILGQAFRPSPAQRQAKTRYWALVSEQAIADDAENIDPYELGKTLQCSALPHWWESNHFKVWFCNRHEHLQRIEYLFDLALDAAEQILQNEDPKAQSARVTMIKVLADLANKRRAERVADSSINQMTPEQLRAFIEKQAPVLLPKGEDE